MVKREKKSSYCMQAKTHNKKFEGNIYTRKVELVGGIELETTSCWEKRSRDGGNGIGGVGSGTLEGEIIRVVVDYVGMDPQHVKWLPGK